MLDKLIEKFLDIDREDKPDLDKTEADKIIRAVQERFVILNPGFINSLKRTQPWPEARAMTFLIMRKFYTCTYEQIHGYCHRDRSTIIHGIKLAYQYVKRYDIYRKAYEDILKVLGLPKFINTP